MSNRYKLATLVLLCTIGVLVGAIICVACLRSTHRPDPYPYLPIADELDNAATNLESEKGRTPHGTIVIVAIHSKIGALWPLSDAEFSEVMSRVGKEKPSAQGDILDNKVGEAQIILYRAIACLELQQQENGKVDRTAFWDKQVDWFRKRANEIRALALPDRYPPVKCSSHYLI